MRTILAALVLLAALSAQAATPFPMILSHSGRLFRSGDVLAQGDVTLVFKLRKLSAPPPVGSGLNDDAVWTDTFQVNAKDGVYQVDLGSHEPLLVTAFEGERFLEITVDGTPLTPRMRVGTAPYAFRASDAATLAGHPATDFAVADHEHDALYYPRAELDTKLGTYATTTALEAVQASVADEASARAAAITSVTTAVGSVNTTIAGLSTTYAPLGAAYSKAESDARFVSVDAPSGGGGALLASWELDEDTGLNFADSSGRKVTLTATGGGQSSGSLGHSGNAVNFSGGVLAAGTNNGIGNTPYVTAEAFVRPATSLTGKQTVMLRDGVFKLMQENGRISFQITASKGTCTVVHPGTTRVGAWSHVAGYYNGREIGVVLDESVVSDTCANGPLANAGTRNFYVGAEGPSRAEAFVGFVDELRLWGTAPLARQGVFAAVQAIPACNATAKGLMFLDGTVFLACDGTNWQVVGGDQAPVTWTLTACGQEGRTGPSQSQCDGAYAGGTNAGKVTVSNGIQSWTVPETGRYRITAFGAEGAEGTYNSGTHGWYRGGRGAQISGVVSLTQGQVLKVLVGQMGVRGLSYDHQPGGGGGGTFVVKADNTPILVAGGGGGGQDPSYGGAEGGPGRIVTSGGDTTAGPSFVGTGGTNGSGATHSSNNTYAANGAGFSGNGSSASSATFQSQSFLNGGTGGQLNTGHNNLSVGGFGGGGAGSLCPGGGGGYSGGSAACNWSSGGRAGGGGSINNGTEQRNLPGVNYGEGKVEIVFLR